MRQQKKAAKKKKRAAIHATLKDTKIKDCLSITGLNAESEQCSNSFNNLKNVLSSHNTSAVLKCLLYTRLHRLK